MESEGGIARPPSGGGKVPPSGWMVFLACLGFFGILMLLGSTPSGSAMKDGRVECASVLGMNGVDHGAPETCAQERSEQMGWALVLAVPSIVLGAGGIALTGRRPDTR